MVPDASLSMVLVLRRGRHASADRSIEHLLFVQRGLQDGVDLVELTRRQFRQRRPSTSDIARLAAIAVG
jgi:hypothetical protein